MAELTPKQRSAVARAVANPELVWVLLSKARGANWVPAFEEAGWLDPEGVPGPTPADSQGTFSIPGWPISHFLAENADEFAKPDNAAVAERILAFMVLATKHAQTRETHNYRVWWNFAKTLRGIPAHLIDEADSSIVAYWLSDPFDRGLIGEELSKWAVDLLSTEDSHSHDLAFSVIKSVFELRIDEGRKDVDFSVSEWYAERIGKRLLELGVERLGQDFIDLLSDRLVEATEALGNDGWSSIWRPAVEEHKQNRSAGSAQDVLVSILRDALQLFVRRDRASAQGKLELLLAGQVQILQRVAIHVLRTEFELVRPLLAHVSDSRFFTSSYRHEMWWLLHDRYPLFASDERRRILEIVSSLQEVNDTGSVEQEASAYRKAIWLAAIKDDEEARRLYDMSVSLCGTEPEHPDFSSYMTVGWVTHESPIPVDELKALSVPDLVARLGSYVEPKDKGFREPGFEGLVKAVRTVIKADPIRYAGGFRRLASLDLPFVYELIEAYSELWRDNAKLPWDSIWPGLLHLGVEITSTEGFWSPASAESPRGFVGNRFWVNGAVGRLIEAGVKDDERAMPVSCHGAALVVLDTVLSREVGERFELGADAVSVAINSPRGRCLEALINLALRECRLADQSVQRHDDAWSKFVGRFERELTRTEDYEFVTLFVSYLPNFLYMSKEWTIARLESVFDRSNGVRWSCAMAAYAYVSSVYQVVYQFLRDGGHFSAALDADHLKKRVVEKIIQNACVAYLQGHESLDDTGGLMALLLRRRNPEEFSHLVRFFWSLRDSPELDGRQRERVVALWRALDAMADGEQGAELPAGKLIRWIDYLPSLKGEACELALRAARRLRDRHENYTYDLLRSIASRSIEAPLEAAELWLVALEASSMSYPDEAIAEGLRNLVMSGLQGRRLAKQIVSAYAKKGNLSPHETLLTLLEPE